MYTKEFLLKTNLFIDNEYLQKYLQIINSPVMYQKYKVQHHHVIPKSYYSRNNIIENKIDDTVILLHKDHVLAHYYMAQCSKDEDLKFINELSFYYLTNKKYLTVSEIELMQSLDNYQTLYEEMCKTRGQKNTGYKFTEEQKQRCSRAQKQRFIDKPVSDEQRKHMSNAQKNRSYQWDESLRTLHSEQITGRKHITNGIEERCLPPQECEKYLKQGWHFGSKSKGILKTEETKQKISKSLTGKKKSEQHIEAARKAKIGRIRITNGINDLFIFEQDLKNYIDQGYYKGSSMDYSFCKNESRCKAISDANSGRIWINNGKESKMVKEDVLKDYINKGFTKGRLKQCISK